MVAYPCSDDPNEVLEAVVSSQANAEKFDKFVNGGVLEEVQLGTGQPTPTLRNLSHLVKSAAAELDGSDVSGKFSDAANGGETLRMLADRFGDMVNVKDFGAVGDGIADDTAAFNAAAAAAGERLVYVPAGTYALSESPAGQFFSDGYVDTGDVEIALTDFGDIRGSEYLDTLDFGLVGHLRRRPEWPDNDDVYVAQGMTTDGETYLYVGQHCNNETQYITKYNITTRTIVSQTKYTTLGHINSMDYKGGKIYVATMDSSNRVAVVDPATMEIETYATPVEEISSVAWDSTRNCWWCTVGNIVKKLSEDFSAVLSSITIPYGEGESAGQGITCYEGMLYFPRYRNDEGTERQRGHVAYVFDPLVGRVVHRWDIAYGISEIEEFCFYKGYLVTTAADSSAYNYYIYGAQFKKGLHTTFGPLPGENKQLPCVKPLHGTAQYMKLYVDASAVSQGVGTADSPFNSIESAFVVMNMVPHPEKQIHVKGDCTENGYQDKLWFQAFPALSILRWGDDPAVSVIPGFSATRTRFLHVSGVTIRPYYRAPGRTSGYDEAVYLSGTRAYFDSISWDTSAYPDVLEGLLYASGLSDVAIGAMDFSGVAAAKISGGFLVRTTDGTQLHFVTQASNISVPSSLSGLHVFDCKGFCDSYYEGFDSLIYKDNTIYVQRVVTANSESIVPNS